MAMAERQGELALSGLRQVVPMTWLEYEALGEDVRGEYISGCLVVTPVGNLKHQKCLMNLAIMAKAACPPGYTAVTEWAWKPGADEFHPDVMVCADVDESLVRFTGIPELLVEVTSSRPSLDLVKKAHKYAVAGAPRFWVVNPQAPSVHAFELREGTYEDIAFAEGDQEITLDFGVGSITFRPNDLLA